MVSGHHLFGTRFRLHVIRHRVGWRLPHALRSMSVREPRNPRNRADFLAKRRPKCVSLFTRTGNIPSDRWGRIRLKRSPPVARRCAGFARLRGFSSRHTRSMLGIASNLVAPSAKTSCHFPRETAKDAQLRMRATQRPRYPVQGGSAAYIKINVCATPSGKEKQPVSPGHQRGCRSPPCPRD